jgi:DNA modification methylase
MTGPRNQVLVGDALQVLRTLPAALIDCVITSPPYYQLRDYGVVGQIGLEASVEGWVDELRAVFGEVARVLKPQGALWLNVTDSYSRHLRYGAPPKSALLGPERLLLALAADGWIVRNKVVWAKPNPMPASVGDRLNTTHELVYLLVRQRQYFFDLDAIRQPHTSRGPRTSRRGNGGVRVWAGPLAGSQDGLRRARANGIPGHPLGKNPGDVWRIPTRGFRGQHFATFPEQLVERPLLATCPIAVCAACGAPMRSVDASRGCGCRAAVVPGLVLDPFFGTGTVGVVATRLGRNWLGIELNPEFLRIAEQRIAETPKPTIAATAQDRSAPMARAA